MLTVGDAFPECAGKAVVSTDLKSATSICPTESAAFGKLQGECADRDAALDTPRTDELCPCNWQKGEEVLKAA